jgi:hypothetical protein
LNVEPLSILRFTPRAVVIANPGPLAIAYFVDPLSRSIVQNLMKGLNPSSLIIVISLSAALKALIEARYSPSCATTP